MMMRNHLLLGWTLLAVGVLLILGTLGRCRARQQRQFD
jgi:hypothetical protein